MNDKNDGRHIDLDVEDLDKNKTSLRRYSIVLAIVLLILVSVVGMFIAAKNVPFEPMTIYSYQVEKSEYCPLEEVQIEQEYEVVDKWYYTLDTYDAHLFMSENDKPYLDVDVDIPIESTPRAVYPSNAIRVAPPVPGQWIAEAEGNVHGRILGIVPVAQKIAAQATPAYTVKEWSECHMISDGE